MHDALGRETTEHGIDLLRGQLRAAVKPPTDHRHERTNDMCDNQLARDGVTGLLFCGPS